LTAESPSVSEPDVSGLLEKQPFCKQCEEKRVKFGKWLYCLSKYSPLRLSFAYAYEPIFEAFFPL